MRIKCVTLAQVVALALLVSLQGCSLFSGEDAYFRNRDGDYVNADKIAPIRVPEGMSGEKMGKLYPVPPFKVSTDFDSSTYEDIETPRPKPLANNLIQESVKIQRIADNRWILINVSPGEVWPRIRGFFEVNGLTIVHSDIAQGIIESSWLQFKADLTKSDRYRLLIDQGVQPETSEIHILHQSIAGKATQDTQPEWPSISTSGERESWLLDELAATLASDETLSGTSLLAQSIGGNAKSQLHALNDEPVMTIKLKNVRARATLFHAMKKEGFSIYDSLPDDGIYYLSYHNISESDDSGWLSNLFNGNPSGKLVAESTYTLSQLKAVLPTGNAFENGPLSKRSNEEMHPNAPGYLLFVTGVDNNFVVRLRDPYGKRLEPREARELLTILRKNLI